ncbi:MAG: hypothetical protein ACTSP5_10305, partial [Candidatus Heimdallarchaeota archaeon]
LIKISGLYVLMKMCKISIISILSPFRKSIDTYLFITFLIQSYLIKQLLVNKNGGFSRMRTYEIGNLH